MCGEIAEMMIDGTLDCETGEFIGEPCGYPRTHPRRKERGREGGGKGRKRQRVLDAAQQFSDAKSIAEKLGWTLTKHNDQHYQLASPGRSILVNLYPSTGRVVVDVPVARKIARDWSLAEAIEKTTESLCLTSSGTSCSGGSDSPEGSGSQSESTESCRRETPEDWSDVPAPQENDHAEQQINDGGPAFPSGRATCDVTGEDYAPNPGMSLRDYFAAAALQGILSGCGGTPEEFASDAYMFADAMIARREFCQ